MAHPCWLDVGWLWSDDRGSRGSSDDLSLQYFGWSDHMWRTLLSVEWLCIESTLLIELLSELLVLKLVELLTKLWTLRLIKLLSLNLWR